MRIAIIGAGMAGLHCGTRLATAGHSVTLFDKGRGPGGRMATRRMALPGVGGEAAFDHGAQYITAKSEAFAAQIEAWAAQGIVAPWPAAGPAAFVGAPGMNAPLKAMAATLDVAWGAEITGVASTDAGWILAPVNDAFEALVIAVPPEQAARLLAPLQLPDLTALAASVKSAPCWTLMAAFAEPVPLSADILRDAGPVGWAARNSAKPGRLGLADGAAETWVVQASPIWSAAHLEDDAEAIGRALLAALAEHAGPLPVPLAVAAHRWRYAQSAGTGEGAVWLPVNRLGVCGDWLVGPRVESAWESGDRLAVLIG